MNKDIKVKNNKQKPNDACPAETEATSELQPKITTSCPACSNTFVSSRFILSGKRAVLSNDVIYSLCKADATNKFLFVIVSVEIRSEDQNHILGSLAVSCIYSVVNFDDVVKIEADGKLYMPQPLVEILNSISISTTRGVMFSTFKGTFLHNAFLPIVDPRSFQQVAQQ